MLKLCELCGFNFFFKNWIKFINYLSNCKTFTISTIKNIRSTILLSEIIKQTIKKGYLINNLDINIITQKPKIQKYKKKILNCIAKICNISPTQINIKGKTTEKLGVIGKEKAIACEVIASVIKND